MIRSTSSINSFQIGFKLSFNQHFQSKIVAGLHRNRRDDLNPVSDYKSEFDLYQKLVEFNRNQLLIDFYNLLIDFFDLLIEFCDLFIDLLIELDRV